jgi:hypothetical protein
MLKIICAAFVLLLSSASAMENQDKTSYSDFRGAIEQIFCQETPCFFFRNDTRDDLRVVFSYRVLKLGNQLGASGSTGKIGYTGFSDAFKRVIPAESLYAFNRGDFSELKKLIASYLCDSEDFFGGPFSSISGKFEFVLSLSVIAAQHTENEMNLIETNYKQILSHSTDSCIPDTQNWFMTLFSFQQKEIWCERTSRMVPRSIHSLSIRSFIILLADESESIFKLLPRELKQHIAFLYLDTERPPLRTAQI